MRKIIPFLWFDDNAEEAAKFYLSIFGNSRILNVTRYNETVARAAGRPEGSVMTVEFELEGQKFVALNGGPQFTFSPAISFVVNCATQGEIDRLWDKLAGGGEEMQCGWLKDRYGVCWQIVPAAIGRMVGDPDPVRAGSVMRALLQMTKIDIGALKKAYGNKRGPAVPARRPPRARKRETGRAVGGRRRTRHAAA